MKPSQNPLLKISDLSVRFPVFEGILRRRTGEITALSKISLTVNQGEVLGIAGESGCGKSTLAKAILHLLRFISPQVSLSGKIEYIQNGLSKNLLSLSNREMRPLRKEIQMVFQDPYSSLNPRMTVFQTVSEPLSLHLSSLPKTERVRLTEKILDRVGLSKGQLHRYPHEFSGGQRQRIAIARSLVTTPRLVIADEPVSALDVSIQAQILNLLKELQKEFDLTYLFIAHDLAVVRHISDRLAVMFQGSIVEFADCETIFSNPKHPYTKLLLSSVPEIGKQKTALRTDFQEQGIPSGCPFSPRCMEAKPECGKSLPLLKEIEPGHFVACPLNGSPA